FHALTPSNLVFTLSLPLACYPSMSCLPLLLRLPTVRSLWKENIIRCRLLDIFKMVISGRPHEIRCWNFGHKLQARVERFESQSIVFVLVGSEGQIPVSGAKVRF